MTGEIGQAWLEHDFDIPTRAKAAGRHRLLIVDGHTSHFNYDLLKYAKENKIIMLCLPSNTTHALQSASWSLRGGATMLILFYFKLLTSWASHSSRGLTVR